MGTGNQGSAGRQAGGHVAASSIEWATSRSVRVVALVGRVGVLAVSTDTLPATAA